jgi:methionyl aminopeptidase
MTPGIVLKTSAEVAGIRESCRLAVRVLAAVGAAVAPGVSTAELDRLAAARVRVAGGEPAAAPGFPGSICLSVNEVAAHGVPGGSRLEAGDTVGVDVAVRLGGWCGDAAASFVAGEADGPTRRLLEAARDALRAGLRAVRAGAHLGDVGAAVEQAAGRWGCSVLAELVGHGIGAQLHEDPEVPPTGRAGEGQRIVPGMVFTLEPALSLGRGRLVAGADGWSWRTEDGARSAQFEHTLAVFRDRTEVLTENDWY